MANNSSPSRWDQLLEASIIGSFTSVGHRIRSRHWSDFDVASLRDKVVVMTGATSGIGRQVATEMAHARVRLRFVARNEQKAVALQSELRTDSGNDDIGYYLSDLSLVSDVLGLADEVLDGEPTIDVLINNAVVLPPKRIITTEGLELSHATNLVAPYVMTNALIPRMVASAPARIINVISGGMYTQGLHVDDLNFAEGEYRGSVAYARAKRRLMVLTKLWADRLSGTEVTVNATHPGWVDTPGVRDSLPGFHRVMGPLLRNAEQGADTILWLAGSAEVATDTGKLWHDREARTEYRLPGTRESAQQRTQLWEALDETVAAIAESPARTSSTD